MRVGKIAVQQRTKSCSAKVFTVGVIVRIWLIYNTPITPDRSA